MLPDRSEHQEHRLVWQFRTTYAIDRPSSNIIEHHHIVYHIVYLPIMPLVISSHYIDLFDFFAHITL